LPQKLSDLPLSSDPFHQLDISDGWGRPFDFSPQPDGSVVLSSKGDKGANDSLVFRFSIVDMPNKEAVEATKLTFVTMDIVNGIIHSYLAGHNRLPSKLSDIDDSPAIVDDGWNVPLSYSVQPDGSVLLVSHGKPGSGQIFSLQFTLPPIVPPGPTTAAAEPSNAAPTSRASPSAP
jgi:hypothetical protein